MASEVEIDDSLYSRQRYVLGDSAMKRMATSNVLVYGLGGLGIEIAKNIVLAGVKSLTIQDRNTATVTDLGTQFFLRESDVTSKKNRAESSAGRLAELNPYVSIHTLTYPLTEDTDLSYLVQFQCVILCECSLNVQLKVNKYCRQQTPQIKFISSDVFGVFGSVFCDFGDAFDVFDSTGEEPKDVFISNITKENPGVVTTMDRRIHGCECGDTVTFKEVRGMTALNGKQFKIKVLTPFKFSICDTSGPEFGQYEAEGIVTQIKVPTVMKFGCLESQLKAPSLAIPDLCKFDAPINIHLGILALHQFCERHKRKPNVWCPNDASEMLLIAKDVNSRMENKTDSIDELLIKHLSYTSQGCLAPLCAAIGGFVAQEGLKAMTGKFSPLNQMLYLDATELLPTMDGAGNEQFQPKGDRYDSLRMCIGEEKRRRLADIHLFMVGCGAIGCEMLKNYALLGIGSGSKGKITITDNDIIEKSNLNRQFLFRPHHIRRPKSTIAAQSVKEINSALKIEAHQQKVAPQTEDSHYNDAFFESQDIIVNALDNLEARRYVDSRCVTTQRALLESGTMGTKGHVQVIVPHITESYNSQRDPADEEFPYCTLKSFPATIEHCIQWARDKFEQMFVQKPNLYNKFWSTNSNIQAVIETLIKGGHLESAVKVCKLAETRPVDWVGCVTQARIKFEKYFNHKAKQLLHCFPLDTTIEDGSPFWQSPKRAPTPLEFKADDSLHMSFIRSSARLYADISGVSWKPEYLLPENLKPILDTISVPAFRPSNKKIETNESAPREEVVEPMVISGDELEQSGHKLKVIYQSASAGQVFSQMLPVEFEKDDDTNGHIDFIAASANLRAQMYSIENADRLKIKRIAGHIVPAIATTTAAISGLVSLEIIKVIDHLPIEKYKNCFLNLALPLILLSEPGPAEKTVIRDGLSFTMWDNWEVKGNISFTLQQFLAHFKEKYGFTATSVVCGVKIVYMPIMALHVHKKRLPQTMVKLLKPSRGQKYVDLIVAFEDDAGNDIPGPPIRYYFGL
ncbi:ubiquitin-like modifier-activating enzyme 6 isoform X1 [Gigantopelta aegis]|uniref:ubiquitin-like modifier-activating enzyme 6 isoform X1 n=1 Tax=Gigantopelta aegis TaxID=1735272 RepID=UPI001B88DC34|nr:ubiquitin-like modifier-activating enzyme 6 isoform X1 [Gigantopelta aegis]XP_041365690.1 ubiquitin-like modifier-activating enzyme 6 isoform X2 [Gigantopelta aegis]XP_041365699.1 ubiquitin-like modifier-activating enzyme 6 isoform X1 [Gigantopelta aegis]